MQTFLPNSNFTISAQSLDSKRLVKQNLEARQILNTLTGKSDGWKNHPAVIQWRGFEKCLVKYSMAIDKEVQIRGFKNNPEFWSTNRNLFASQSETPKFLGNEEFHSSHRAKLLFKGRVDSICQTLKAHFKSPNFNNWLKSNGYNPKNQLQYGEIIKLENVSLQHGLTILQNWYIKFGWSEPDDNSVPYFWPSKN